MGSGQDGAFPDEIFDDIAVYSLTQVCKILYQIGADKWVGESALKYQVNEISPSAAIRKNVAGYCDVSLPNYMKCDREKIIVF